MRLLRVVELRTEGFPSPLGIDASAPRFRWQIRAKARGVRQARYHLQCASTPERLANPDGHPDLWDSGWIDSEQPLAYYGGVPLQSRQQVYWRVRVQDAGGGTSPWSKIARFEMGLLTPTDWQAQWIAPSVDKTKPEGVCKDLVNRSPATLCPYLRKVFHLAAPVASARLYVTGLGYYQVYLNERKVGDAYLEPSYTPYHKRIEYRTYDVGRLLKEGVNCIGAWLGQSWWMGPLCLLAQLEITLTNGERVMVLTDRDWRWAPSPLIEQSIYGGETYDARRAIPYWSSPRLRPRRGVWRPVRIVRMPRSIRLSASPIEPIEVVQLLVPKQVSTPKPGIRVYDFGQNLSGWCRLIVNGARGTQVRLRHAELLYPDGTVNQENLRNAKATDTYILKGGGGEFYEPCFTYHGFRYVQVETDPPDALTTGQIEHLEILAAVAHTAFEPRGHFECSNPLFNQIHHNACWGYRTNFHSIPTDCPQRDERQGWMGDAHMTCAMGLYNFDTEQAYRKFLRDIADEQGADGSIPDTVPFVWGTRPGDPMWSLAYPMIVWTLYQHTGDIGILREHYRGIRKYLRSLEREAPDGILTRNNYGDWVAVEEGTPKPLVSTCAFALTALLTRQIALALGDTRTAQHAQRLHQRIAEAFHRAFYNPEIGGYDGGTQASNVLALAGNLVPGELVPTVVESLVRTIRDKHHNHLATGFVGTRFLLEMLTAYGHGETAYQIANQTDYPSWGYMLANGATTIWELWRLETGPGMNSHNHPAFGFISGWFYDTLVGLRPQAGWTRFEVVPHPLGNLRWAEAHLQTALGEVYCGWERVSNRFTLGLMVPPCASATLILPSLGFTKPLLLEGERLLWRNGKVMFQPKGVFSVDPLPDGGFRIPLGSGNYTFHLVDYRRRF